ncbi:hypothetical protein WIS52_25660 [Pseudonocardia nematodicida]|uniref:DUF732 domain-containing protein n=1 Tax=Pseudonocardia nematodicida TaxID=1206997 RepID=A0ABV1KHE6_9PSEU
MNARVIYASVGALLAALLVVMLVSYDYNRSDEVALGKADELIGAYRAAGLATPADAGQVAQVLGDDGGAVCATAGSPHQLGLLKTRLGVGGEFYLRPATVDPRTVQGLELVVATYCPEDLPAVEQFVAGLDVRPAAAG